MNTSLNRLNWDSNFFGFDVYSTVAETRNVLLKDINSAWKLGAYFVYAMTNLNLDNEFLNNTNGLFVGTKVIFKKTLVNPYDSKDIEEFLYDIVPSDLLELAYQSGVDSRFKLDTRLPHNTFKKMYKLWLEKATTNRNIKTLVYRNLGKIVGFISIEIRNNRAQIGLFAVDNQFRGMGIGKKLLSKAEFTVSNMGINELYIPTQKENKSACLFYSKQAYSIISETRIYHFLNNNL